MDVLVRGEAELFARTAHLFSSAREIFCAANDLHTWAAAHRVPHTRRDLTGRSVRKLYRPASLLQPGGVAHLRERERMGARIRITLDEINETIVLDRKVAILAGDASGGERGYSVVTSPEVIGSVTGLFNAAWRAGTELAIYDTEFREVRALAPRILDELASGSKDETAARALGLSVRTYRRRVAELMAALGATSRFQAGARARELGLI
ncbi:MULTISPECIES: helix-turn-helix transcriptional regulator [Amycolatopsis]|uniref:Response regulator transcription factor n=1 Tax=Amycolatopsis thermalba TaxID=944492 RepID=A0ABY4NQC7_9PSEU|nr:MULTISPECIES: response regulator transcription factor [Amycolatopsis]OXM74221.1 LuxR family transcriptional regulator [Amycolatopsis sp. KNN50.9b]UQS22176.1 response regulator transcription factor [Amycolatopsis thermalba]